MFTSIESAFAAIREMGGKPRHTHWAKGFRRDGADYWVIVAGDFRDAAAPARNERAVYTPSGKKTSSRAICGHAFRKFANDRRAFVAFAVEKGVKPATANAMFSHYTKGRYA